MMFAAAPRRILRAQAYTFRLYQISTPHRASSTSQGYSFAGDEQHRPKWSWSERIAAKDCKNGSKLGRYFMSAWATWKKQHQTASWQRHFEQFRNQGGPGRCLREVVDEMKQRTARYVGTLKAGAPQKPPLQPAGRQLVAYLSPVSQELRSTKARHQLALVQAPLLASTGTGPLLHIDPCELLYAFIAREIPRMFKTSDILTRLNVLSRVTFSLLPLTLLFRFKAARITRLRGKEALAGRFYPTRTFVWSLLATPLVLVGLAYLASLERTPVTGRTRSVFLSEVEKSGMAYERALDTEEDWLLWLREKLFDTKIGALPNTLLGGVRLPADDWRVDFVEKTLRQLEAGIPMLDGTLQSGQVGDLVIPKPALPLDNAYPAPNYRLIMIDRPEANAFSCGFAPIGHGIGPGCIVVFSGCIDAILREASVWPSQPPTRQQQDDLAVLLSHELAHLVCSHTLEQHASNKQRPQLRMFAADVVRTILYPISFLLGPFVNEAISASLMAGFNGEPGISSSCESRLHETEADAVSLRILANAGFDPRISVRYWEDRIASPPPSQKGMHGEANAIAQFHSTRNQFLRSHPVDAERLAAIKSDLAKWKRCA